jgi:hypothetical protein
MEELLTDLNLPTIIASTSSKGAQLLCGEGKYVRIYKQSLFWQHWTLAHGNQYTNTRILSFDSYGALIEHLKCEGISLNNWTDIPELGK